MSVPRSLDVTPLYATGHVPEELINYCRLHPSSHHGYVEGGVNDPLSFISVCTGVGGLDMGFELAIERVLGRYARPVLHVEREAYCLAVLAARMQEQALAPAPVFPDLRRIPRRTVDDLRGRVDAVVGGIPCQGNSLAGKRLLEAVDDPVHADGYRGRGWVSDGVGECPYLALLEAIRYRRIGQKTARQLKRSGRKAAAKGRA